MKKLSVALLLALAAPVALAQAPPASLTPDEIAAAVAAKSNSGFAMLEDMGFATPSICKAQMPSEAVFTPSGWVKAQSEIAKTQFLAFKPTDSDTLREITVISRGCVDGRAGGPACDSITRVVLLSDKDGGVIAEPTSSAEAASTWHNGFGAQATCANLVSKFAMTDVERVRAANPKHEFLIATFAGATRLKTYTVKDKYIQKLGM